MSALLEIRDLKVAFVQGKEARRALDGISFGIDRGRTLGIVGESGCGKSLTALSIMRLLPEPPARIEGGEIVLATENKPRDLLKISAKEMRHVRGREIAMIFQEPMTSLDPVYTIGEQIAEVLMTHEKMSRTDALARAVTLLRDVGIPSPEERIRQYPHELSGGMRQRAMIAIALACAPAILIADEPTTALDVTIQAQVLELMRNMQQRLGTALILITHDMGVIADMADDVLVMYLGRIIERGTATQVLERPAHPYTQGLIASLPKIDMPRGERLVPIQGTVPGLGAIPSGCRFHTRCPHVMDVCRREDPAMRSAEPGHDAACWLIGEAPPKALP
jgi:oligopeptide/dipeptide ABC transporter ATP-binding protein